MTATRTTFIKGVLLKETAKARLLVDEDGNQAWFPISQMIYYRKVGQDVVAEVPMFVLNNKVFATSTSMPRLKSAEQKYEPVELFDEPVQYDEPLGDFDVTDLGEKF